MSQQRRLEAKENMNSRKKAGFFSTHSYRVSFPLLAPTLLSQHPLQKRLTNS